MIKESIDKINQSLEDEDSKIMALKMKLFNLVRRNPVY
tara:strand:+ start:2914 stop:3027 length:114 start_codon:yes stop_codon:yes gene_type:complete